MAWILAAAFSSSLFDVRSTHVGGTAEALLSCRLADIEPIRVISAADRGLWPTRWCRQRDAWNWKAFHAKCIAISYESARWNLTVLRRHLIKTCIKWKWCILNSEKELESLHKRWRDKIPHLTWHLSLVYGLIRLRTEISKHRPLSERTVCKSNVQCSYLITRCIKYKVLFYWSLPVT